MLCALQEAKLEHRQPNGRDSTVMMMTVSSWLFDFFFLKCLFTGSFRIPMGERGNLKLQHQWRTPTVLELPCLSPYHVLTMALKPQGCLWAVVSQILLYQVIVNVNVLFGIPNTSSFFFFKQAFALYFRLALDSFKHRLTSNSQGYSCLSLRSAGITGIHHHTQLPNFLLD